MTRQLDVDEILRSWLAEGIERAPEAHVDAALGEIERTPQRHPPIVSRLGWRSDVDRPSLIQPLAFAAIGILVVLIGVGVGIRTGAIRLAPTPLPLPSALDDAEPEAGVETFTAPDGSFEIRLPERWNADDGPDSSALYLVGQALRLSIRAGDADGGLLTCDEGAGPWETCRTYRDSTGTLDSLAAAIGLTSAAEEGIAPLGPTRSATTLDGEPAKVEKIEAYEYPARGAEFVTYVVAMHDGRPFILRAWSPGSAGIDILDIISGFSFLEPRPTPTPSPSPEPSASVPESEWVTFTGPDRSFQIRLTSEWSLVDGPDETALYLRHEVSRIRLSIRAGDADGRLQTCDAPVGSWELCRTVAASTLEELRDAIGLIPDADYWQGPITSETTLNGEPAISTGVVGKNPNPIAVKYVVAMHGGRPFVVRASQPAPTDGISEMASLLAGFKFLEPSSFVPEGMALELYSNPEQGYEIGLPSAWIDRVWDEAGSKVPDSTTVAFRDTNAVSGIAVQITVGEPGTMTLDALEELLVSMNCGDFGELHDYRYLGGEPAGEERPERGNSCLGYPGARYHVYAIHDGRPVVLAFDYWLFEFGRYAPRIRSWTFADTIVDSFRFTDE